jgi:hypothetical protein
MNDYDINIFPPPPQLPCLTLLLRRLYHPSESREMKNYTSRDPNDFFCEAHGLQVSERMKTTEKCCQISLAIFPGEFPQIWIYIEIAEEASQLSDF